VTQDVPNPVSQAWIPSLGEDPSNDNRPPEWLIKTAEVIDNIPVLSHIIHAMSRVDYAAGNLIEGDIQNFWKVLNPWEEIDDPEEMTLVSDVLLPEGSHWMAKFGLDVVASPWTLFSPGIGGVKGLRVAGITKKGGVSSKVRNLRQEAKWRNVPVEELPQFKGLRAEVKKAGHEISDLVDFGDTFGTQARLGQRALLTMGGKALIKGEPALEVITAISQATRKTSIFKTFNTMFGVTKDPFLRTAQIIYGGDKAKLIHRADDAILEFDDIVKGLSREEVSQIPNVLENFSTIDKVAVNPKVLQAAAVMGKTFDDWVEMGKKSGIKIPDLKDKFIKRAAEKGIPKAILMKEVTGVMRKIIDKDAAQLLQRIGKEAASRHSKGVNRLNAQIQNVARSFKGNDITAVSAVAEVQKVINKEMRSIAKRADIPPSEILNSTPKDVKKALGKEDGEAFLQLKREAVVLNRTARQEIDLVGQIEKHFDNVAEPTALKAAENAADAELVDKARVFAETIANEPNYLPHILSQDALDVMRKRRPDIMKKAKSSFGARLLQREFAFNKQKGLGNSLSLKEIEEVFKRGDATGIGLSQEWQHELLAVSGENSKRLNQAIKKGNKGQGPKINNVQDAINHGFVDDVARYFETDSKTILESFQRSFIENLTDFQFRESANRLWGARLVGAPIPASFKSVLKKDGTARKNMTLVDKTTGEEVSLVSITEASSPLDEIGELVVKSEDGIESTKSITQFDHPPQSVKDGIKNVESLPESFRQADIQGTVSGVYFPDEIATEMERMHDFMRNVDVQNEFLRFYDGVQNTWKASVTGIWPAFNSRNAVSNLFLSFLKLGGRVGDAPRLVASYGKAFKLQWYGMNPLKNRKALQKMKFNTQEGVVDGHRMLDIIMEYDVTAGNAHTNDLTRFTDPLKGKSLLAKGVNTTTKPFQLVGNVGRRVGNTIESNSKMGHFIHEIERNSLDYVTAQNSVMATLFNYGDLTPFESSTMKRIMPWYTWSRKAVPSMVSAVFMNPKKVNSMGRFLDEFDKQNKAEWGDLPNELLPQYLRDTLNVTWRVDEDGNREMFILDGWLPLAEVNKLDGLLRMSPKKFGKRLSAELSPLIKNPFELLFNRALFFDKEIEQFENQRVSWMGFRPKATDRHILSNIRLLNEADNLMRTQLDPGDHRYRETKDSLYRFIGGIKTQSLDIERQTSIADIKKQREIRGLKGFLNFARKTGQVDNELELIQQLNGMGYDIAADDDKKAKRAAAKLARQQEANEARNVGDIDKIIRNLVRDSSVEKQIESEGFGEVFK